MLVFLFYNFQMYQNIILFVLLCSFVQANLIFQRQNYNHYFVQGFTYVDIQCEQGILATLSTDHTTNLVISYKKPNFVQKQKILSLSSSEKFRIRLPAQNYGSDFNDSLILFSETSLTNFFSFSNLNEEILDFSIQNNSYYIVDLCYGNNRKEIIVMGFFYNTSSYGFILFNNSITPTTIKLLNISSSISFLDKIIYLNSRIYAHFSDKTIIYLLDSNFTEDACFSYPLVGQIQYLHFQVGLEIFMYCQGTEIVVRNSTSYQLLAEYSHDSFISGAFVEGTYIIFMDDDSIIQYDYEIKSIISISMVPTIYIYTLMYLSSSTFLVFYELTYMPSDSILIYNFTSSYDSNTSNCLNTYLFSSNQLLCIKDSNSSNSSINLNSSIINNNSNVSDTSNNSISNLTTPVINSSISNSSNLNTTNLLQNSSLNYSILNNTTINSLQNASILINSSSNASVLTPFLAQMNSTITCQDDQYNIDVLIREYIEYLNRQYGLGFTYGTSSLLILSSIKISPQFLYSLVIIFNDLWFYQFHNKSYPHSIKIIFKNVDIIETQKINVWFLQLIEIFNKTTNIGLESNNQMQKYLSINSIQEQNVFFIRSMVQNYRNSFVLPLVFYFLLKILKKMIYPIKKKARCIFLFFNFIRVNSKLWLSISSIIENIIPNLGFDIGVQMLLPSFFNTFDKFNFIICVLVFFIVIAYSFTFYPLIFYFSVKKSRKELMRTCKNNMSGFFFQPALFVFRVLLRSFIHSYLIQNYVSQVFFLIIVDCFSICISIYIRKYYKSILIFSLYTLYLIFLTTFDVYFYFESLYKFPKYLRRQLFGVTILGALFIISVLACLTFFFKFVLNLLKNCKKLIIKNKITKTSAHSQTTRPKLSMCITTKYVSSDEKNKQKQSKMILTKITAKSVYKKDDSSIRISNKSFKDKQLLMKNIMQVKVSDHIKESVDQDNTQLPEIKLSKTISN